MLPAALRAALLLALVAALPGCPPSHAWAPVVAPDAQRITTSASEP